jgi:hypothetical protein
MGKEKKLFAHAAHGVRRAFEVLTPWRFTALLDQPLLIGGLQRLKARQDSNR